MLLDATLLLSYHAAYQPIELAAAVMFVTLKRLISNFDETKWAAIRSLIHLHFDEFDYFFDKFLRTSIKVINLPQIFKAIKYVSCFVCPELLLQQIPIESGENLSYEDLASDLICHSTMTSVINQAY